LGPVMQLNFWLISPLVKKLIPLDALYGDSPDRGYQSARHLYWYIHAGERMRDKQGVLLERVNK